MRWDFTVGEMYLKTHIEMHECEIISIDKSTFRFLPSLSYILSPLFQFQFYPLDEHMRGEGWCTSIFPFIFVCMFLTNIECDIAVLTILRRFSWKLDMKFCLRSKYGEIYYLNLVLLCALSKYIGFGSK